MVVKQPGIGHRRYTVIMTLIVGTLGLSALRMILQAIVQGGAAIDGIDVAVLAALGVPVGTYFGFDGQSKKNDGNAGPQS